MAIYSGVLPQQQGYGSMSSRQSDVPFTEAGVVNGATQAQPTQAGAQARPQSPNVLPEKVAANVAKNNPWAMNTVTGGLNLSKAVKNYATLSRQYGGDNPQEWVPWQEKDVAAGGAGGFGNLDLYINPTYEANIGKDFKMQQTGYDKGLFARDIQRNPYTGEILGYGQYSEINPTAGVQSFGKDFWEKNRVKGEWNSLIGAYEYNPDLDAMKKQINAQTQAYMAQNPDLFNAAVNTGYGTDQNALALALLMNSAPGVNMFGRRNSYSVPWKNLYEYYGGSEPISSFNEEFLNKNYNPYGGPSYTTSSYGAM